LRNGLLLLYPVVVVVVVGTVVVVNSFCFLVPVYIPNLIFIKTTTGNKYSS
jgi:hypothetical protein